MFFLSCFFSLCFSSLCFSLSVFQNKFVIIYSVVSSVFENIKRKERERERGMKERREKKKKKRDERVLSVSSARKEFTPFFFSLPFSLSLKF